MPVDSVYDIGAIGSCCSWFRNMTLGGFDFFFFGGFVFLRLFNMGKNVMDVGSNIGVAI